MTNIIDKEYYNFHSFRYYFGYPFDNYCINSGRKSQASQQIIVNIFLLISALLQHEIFKKGGNVSKSSQSSSRKSQCERKVKVNVKKSQNHNFTMPQCCKFVKSTKSKGPYFGHTHLKDIIKVNSNVDIKTIMAI